jgi:hypothetical protein
MKRKTTVYIDDSILRALKVSAAKSGQREYQIVEQALRAYLGLDLLERVPSQGRLTEKSALDLAYRELHQSRRS